MSSENIRGHMRLWFAAAAQEEQRRWNGDWGMKWAVRGSNPGKRKQSSRERVRVPATKKKNWGTPS